ncbi:hypothetical protein Salat_2922900 [Sesamum alatum]|uniref:Pollen Ole e 1 allergen and extensin family protein n=1 Tax=Sesamum alatum TaxID=300844 RepID=A0AAE2C8B8_9LAMI|nr:hypothetical protein Salat_2922900 [Sesamum alatum]
MAHNQTSALFLISLLLFAAAAALAHGQLSLGGLKVGGQLCCTSTGNCPGQGVPGAIVNLNCNILGATTTVGQATTNANGSFNITVPALTGLVLGLPIVPCVAAVQLPLDGVVCPVLSTTQGVLSSVVQSVDTVVSTVLGLVQNATAVGFIRMGV